MLTKRPLSSLSRAELERLAAEQERTLERLWTLLHRAGITVGGSAAIADDLPHLRFYFIRQGEELSRLET